MFNVPMDIAGRNHVVMDGVSSHMSTNSLIQSDLFHLNSQNQFMIGLPVLPMLQGETINGLHADFQMTSRPAIVDSDELVSRNSSLGQACPIGSTNGQEQFNEVTTISASSLATLLATKSGLHENLDNLAISATSVFPSEDLRTFVSSDCSNTSNSSLATSVDCPYDGVLSDMTRKWGFDKFLPPPELTGKTTLRTGFQPFHIIGDMDPNGWISSSADTRTVPPYGSSNELSLSLATSQPSVMCRATAPNQCSERSCSGVTHPCLNEVGLGSEQGSCNSKELSLSFGSYRPAQFSQVISGSRYLHVIQEILAEILNYSLENLDHSIYSTTRTGGQANVQLSSGYAAQRGLSVMGSDEFPDEDGRYAAVPMDPVLQKREVEAKKTQLLALLQVVDDQYNQCLDEIHTVISAFHAATELDPQIHARFALHTISLLYKNLRERISNQILAMGTRFTNGCTSEKERPPFESSFIQKQWDLQQLRRKDHQLWRPQRGLPERSVSVLRAWMFQNFLHPYPKDAEKHLLAVKSGLTRSQVSNWFINARVRLWKPMIEEMYSEMNRRKGRRNDEESNNSNRRSTISMDNQRYKII